MLIALACMAGIALGMVSTVFIMLPATVVGILLGVRGMQPGLDWGTAAVLVAVALQGGYIIGLTLREPVNALREKLSLIQSRRA